MPGLQCRFYRSKYPSVEDVVMVTITSIEDMGAYVMLLEYGNVEGMILMSELSRRRIRSINKLIRVGRNEIVVVIRVDADKGYIDLSKRRVAQEERQKCDEKFAKGKQINLLLRNVSEKLHYTTDSQLEELYRKTAWYFDEKYNRDNASYDVFKRAVNDKSLLDECDIDDVTRKEMLEEIQHRLAPNPVKIRADIEVSCFGFEGIDAIKNALKKGIACSTDELPLKVNLIAPPLYVVTTTTLERTCGLQLIRKALDEIEEEITNSKGSFKVKSEPRVVTQKDDSELEKELERLEQQGKDVDGDDDSDSESSTGSSDEEKGGDIS